MSSLTEYVRPAALDEDIVLAVVQDSPVVLDLQATLVKLADLTKKAAQQARASLTKLNPDAKVVVVFPEAFLSAYLRGMDVSVPRPAGTGRLTVF